MAQIPLLTGYSNFMLDVDIAAVICYECRNCATLLRIDRRAARTLRADAPTVQQHAETFKFATTLTAGRPRERGTRKVSSRQRHSEELHAGIVHTQFLSVRT